MSNGPTIIVDKSALQGLSKTEAKVLEWMFTTNILPVLYVEILADLYKPPPKGRTAEKVVADLAAKMPAPISAYPNVYHGSLVLGDLLGYSVEMRGVPAVGGGQQIKAADGRTGLFFDESPEAQAFGRWRAGDFQAVERDFAQGWRSALESLDLKAVERALKSDKGRASNLREALSLADTFIAAHGQRYTTLLTTLEMLNIPSAYRPAIIRRWKALGGPELREFAPYAAYVVRVEVFFYAALGAGLIRRVEPNHRTDISYIFYLPFCKVFTSCDNFHAEVAPLFMGPRQMFVSGADLKEDLNALAGHFAALPDEVRAKGSSRYAGYPPLDGKFLVSTIFDRVCPGWRADAARPQIEITPEMNRKIMEQLRPMLDAIETERRRWPKLG